MTANILALEERAFRAWPCFRSIMIGGWIVRFADGFTKRANSANALRPTAPFEAVMEAVESAYAAQGLPAIFRLSPLAPSDADAMLSRAGYDVVEPSHVMTAPLIATSAESEPAVMGSLSAEWMEGFAGASGLSRDARDAHGRIVRGIVQPRTFATIYRGGEAVGFGMAALDNGAVGLFDIMVAAGHRGGGVGRAVTGALLRWGANEGAGFAYLQVHQGNGAAVHLYRGLGFTVRYDYHYRIKPPGGRAG